jgi:hypothetical protein
MVVAAAAQLPVIPMAWVVAEPPTSVSRRMHWQTASSLRAGAGAAPATVTAWEVLLAILRAVLPPHVDRTIVVAVVRALRLAVRQDQHLHLVSHVRLRAPVFLVLGVPVAVPLAVAVGAATTEVADRTDLEVVAAQATPSTE